MSTSKRAVSFDEDDPTPTPQDRKRPDLVRQRHADVIAAQERWTRKLKRAQNALKKLRARRRYYERKLSQL